MESRSRRLFRFGTFEVDSATGELRRAGRPVGLQEQPFRLLLALLECPAEIVTRAELREKLWGETHVDFEEGLNTAVRKLRDALGDSASNPRFIETLPRRGYRFIAPVESVADPALLPKALKPVRARSWLLLLLGGSVVSLAVAAILVYWFWFREKQEWTASPPTQLTRDSGMTSEPVISRDGKLLAYTSDRAGQGNTDIWMQLIAGGEPRRLTDDPADDHEPDISPDGSTVIFRSERDPPGIYAVPALGGKARLIMRDGHVPRYSPDGSRIAYSLGNYGSGGFSGTLRIYEFGTGSTKRAAQDRYVGGPVAWSRDGSTLIFAGWKNLQLRPLHLWSCSPDGGISTQLTVEPVSEDRAVFGQVSTVSVAWLNDRIIVSRRQGDSANVWAGTVATGTQRLVGGLRRLTFGTGNEVMPSVSSGGRLVFANHTYAAGIWEATPGKDATAAAMHAITHDGAINYKPSVSADGSKLAYVSNRTGNFEVWIKDLLHGDEVALTHTAVQENSAAISRDGTKVAYSDGMTIWVAAVSGGEQRALCERCGRPDDWSPDGKVITAGGPRMYTNGISSVDPATSKSIEIANHGILVTTAPHLSPDGKWLTFHTSENTRAAKLTISSKRQVFVAPYNGYPVPPANWIPITDGEALDREARWSTDGNQIYFLSDRDGFRCIWKRSLNPSTKQPSGPIHPALHLHNSHLSLLHIPDTGNVSICPVGNKLIFAMGELSSNLWMTDLKQ
jgi:Tol biopolymer transport system component/DNA-binding winged helix-turn-helix (wHTH) protein